VEAGAVGCFATHLHLLQALPLRDEGVARWRMEVIDDPDWEGALGARRPAPGDALANLLFGGPSASADSSSNGGGGNEPYPLAGRV
jgi:hypothetical protein